MLRGQLRRRRLRLVLAVFLVLVVAWVLACDIVVMHPRTDRPRAVDAILVLGPPDEQGRVDEGLRLAQQGYSHNVVISIANEAQRRAKGACGNPFAQLRIVCFEPDPATTRGEAREIARLAEENHWHSVMVVTSSYHISRARMIVNRCFDGDVTMIEAPGRTSWWRWPYQFVYQSAGYLKAAVLRGC